MIRPRASEFQSMMMEFRGCSTLDESLLRGYLLADLPAEVSRPVETHIQTCHCCKVALQILSRTVSSATPHLPDDLREQITRELADFVSDRDTRIHLPGGFPFRMGRKRKSSE